MSGMWTALECRPSPTQSWLPRFVKSVTQLGFEHGLNTTCDNVGIHVAVFGMLHVIKALSCSASNCHMADQDVVGLAHCCSQHLSANAC